MLDLMTLPAPDAERLAYAEGFTQTAALFARLDDLQRALGQAVADLETLRVDARRVAMLARDALEYPNDAEISIAYAQINYFLETTPCIR